MSNEILKEMQADKTEILKEMQAEKTAWGPGPWQDEPDRVDFIHAGFACLALRNQLGAWCGYVGVGPDHPLHGREYDDADVEVPGGLTYGDRCQGNICHVAAPGMPEDVWWFGFDCAHSWDMVPGVDAALRAAKVPPRPPSLPRQVYRDLGYVRKKIESLADQLRAVTPVPTSS